jgi:hypothetical protein
LAHRRATATGAPFPLATAGRLAREALREAGGAETHALLAELESGQSWLAPQQVARSQTVRLVVQPAGQDLLDRLAVLLSLA